MADYSQLGYEPAEKYADLGYEAAEAPDDHQVKTFGDHLADYWHMVNPKEQAQGLADIATTDPRKTLAAAGSGTDRFRLAAVKSFKQGAYTDAARHAFTYLTNGVTLGMTGALDEAGTDLQEGRIGDGVTKTAAMATNIIAGKKFGDFTAAATEPGAAAAALVKTKQAGQTTAAVTKAAVKAAAPDLAAGTAKVAGGAAMDYAGIPGHVGTILGVREGAADLARGAGKGFKAGRQVLRDRANPPAPAEPIRVPGVQDPAAIEPRTPAIDTSTELSPQGEARNAARVPAAEPAIGPAARQPGVQDAAAVEPRTPIIDTSTELTPEAQARMAARHPAVAYQDLGYEPAEALPAKPASSDPKLLDDISMGMSGKPFERLTAGEQAGVLRIADRVTPQGKPPAAEPVAAVETAPAQIPAVSQELPVAPVENKGAAPVAPAESQPVVPAADVQQSLQPAAQVVESSSPDVARMLQPAEPTRLAEPAYEHASEPAAGGKPDYQAAARTVKGKALGRFLTNPPEGPAITAEEATRMTPEQWQIVAREAGVAAKTPPSIETQKIAIEHMREIEGRRAQRALPGVSGPSTFEPGDQAPAGGKLLTDGGTDEAGRPIEAPNPGTGSEGVPLPAASGPGGEPGASATEVEIPGAGRSIPATYRLRELSDVQASHNGLNFQPNPRYTLTNDRNYSKVENQGKVIEGSGGKFKPAFHITDNPDAVNGPPVIDSKGNAMGGNGRTMQLQRVYAYNPQGAAAYRELLTKKAAQFGIDPAEVAGMKQPVLVREVADEHVGQVGRAITDLNKTGTAPLTPAERAIADSRRVSPATLDHIAGKLDELGPDGTLAKLLSGDDGLAIVQRLTDDGVLTKQQTAELLDNGKLTPAAKTRISKLMLGRFFRDPATLDHTPAAIVAKLERLAAPVAKLEGEGAWNLMPKLQESLDLLEEARAHGTRNISEFLKQSGLLGETRYTEDAVTLAKALQRFTGRQISQAVKDYSATAQYAAERADQAGGIFGDQLVEQPKDVAQRVDWKTPAAQPAAIATPARPAPTPAEAFEAAFRPGSKAASPAAAGKPAAAAETPKGKSTAQKLGEQLRNLLNDTEGAIKGPRRAEPVSPDSPLAANADDYQSRIDAERATLELQQKSRKRADSGKESIEDSPLFGGPRQGGLF